MNDVNLQKITATQVYAISNLTGFMCNKIIIPYLKNEQINEMEEIRALQKKHSEKI